MPVRGVRGATVAEENNIPAILGATRELLLAMLKANPGLRTEDLASAFFTVTDDLDATYPALAARGIGWHQVPMLCAREIPVPTGIDRVIRVLLHWNTDCAQDAIRHVYLHEAAALRPDLMSKDF
jgi:chorismate mutase